MIQEKAQKLFITRFRYSTFLVKYPSVSVTLTLIILVVAIVLSVVTSAGGKLLPDFSNPVKVSKNISYYECV